MRRCTKSDKYEVCTETFWNKFEVNILKQISLSLRVWRWRLSKVDKDKVNKVNKVVEGVVGVEDAEQGGGWG